MSALVRFVAAVLALACCFLAGLHGGPRLAGLWYSVFPPAAYTTGDHRPLYARAGRPVVMYATASCPYCAKARALLAEHGVAWTEYRIDASAAAKADFHARSGIGVPLLYIGERRIEGFREDAIIDALRALREQG